ncbi:MAG: hypothetical protein RBR38_15360 [Desulfomicrobium apsheronum]|nr:hypothetical protein [Desulfomicrobium apsheronum]
MHPSLRPVLLLLPLLLLSACDQEALKQPEPRTIKAQIMSLALTEARECRSLPGQVESRNSVTLTSKTSGTVTEILAREVAATLFSRMVVPVMYYLDQRGGEIKNEEAAP